MLFLSEMEINIIKKLLISQVAVVADRALFAVFALVTTLATGAILLPQFKNLHVGNTPLKHPA